MTTDYTAKLREIASTDADPDRRREAARRLHARGESVEGRPMKEVLTEKIADSKKRTDHYRAISDADTSTQGLPSISLPVRDAGFTASWGGKGDEPAPKFDSAARKPPAVPIPDEEPEYPALDALIAKYRAEAQQPAHDPVVVNTVAQSSVADKLAVARAADRVKQIERVEKLRTKRPKRRDYITTYDPITGEPQ